MSEQQIQITPKGDALEIRTGQALPLKEPLKVQISGTITSVADWLDKRASEINEKECHILVDREYGKISLFIDETNHYRQEITATLEKHPSYILFGVNSGTYRTALQMAELIKMNRACFENRDESMKLVTALKNVKVKVEAEINKTTDDRGTDRNLKATTVIENNVPETITLNIPIFKGQPKQLIHCEIYFNPADVTCTLISPAANETVADSIDTIIDAQITRISACCPDIAIIEH